MPERRRNPPARYTLPVVIEPRDTICFKIHVPNDIGHLMAFYGQIYALARAYTWGNDTAHSAKLAAAVWLKIFDALIKDNCECDTSTAGADEGVETLIRQNPDNPCLLETSINGTDWCAFADLSLCLPSSGQPGAGASQPPANGGSACYNARLQASSKWLLPYQVSTGDVITITETDGSWSDGSGLWQCPNGKSFFLGACTGSTTLSGSDPAPSLAHASLIAKIGSTYYPAYNTTITVPSGVSLANVEFQMNDPSLTDNYGAITFKACVQNNAVATWAHTFDFVTGDHGFTRKLVGVAGWIGDYIPGVGWKITAPSDAGNCYGVACGIAVPSSITLTSLYAEFSSTGALGGICTARLSLQTSVVDTGASHMQLFNTTAAGGPFGPNTFSQAGASWIMCFGSAYNTGTTTLTKLIVTGLGADPF